MVDQSNPSDEALLRQLIERQQRSICAGDIDSVMALYKEDAIIFDVKPPYQTSGSGAIRQLWEDCMPGHSSPLKVETRDMTLTTGGKLAFAHWLWRFTGLDETHPAMQTWIRTTGTYRKDGDRWLIVHEHSSVPFDPETGRALFTLNP